MITKDYTFPYSIDGSFICDAVWEDDLLSVTLKCYDADDSAPNLLVIHFHGVSWMRSTCHESYPISEDNWNFCHYSPEKPIDSYLFVEREWFANRTALFTYGDALHTIRALDDGVLFIDDRFIFPCTEAEIIYTECISKRAFALLDELTDNGDVTYHDGGIFDIKYDGDVLEFCCFRFQSDWEKEDDGSFENCIHIRFGGVSELEIYDYDKSEYLPYREGDFEDGGRWTPYVDGLDFFSGKIVFEDSLRFKYTDVIILKKFREEWE